MDERADQPIDPPIDPADEPGLSDVELGSDPPGGPPPRRRTSAMPWILGVLTLLLIAAAVYYFGWVRRAADEILDAPAMVETLPPDETPAVDEDESEGEPAPPLEASDEWVRGLVNQLSSHPRLVAWLAPERLVRRFVAATDAIALGDSPRPQIRFATPDEPLVATRQGSALRIDPASYERFAAAVELFDSLDPAGSAATFRRLEPLLDQAYSDLGYPDEAFRPALDRAARRLLDVPVPDGPIALDPREIPYQFQDPELEALSPAAKLLLRLGPDQARRVQAKIRQLLAALDAPTVQQDPDGPPAGEPDTPSAGPGSAGPPE